MLRRAMTKNMSMMTIREATKKSVKYRTISYTVDPPLTSVHLGIQMSRWSTKIHIRNPGPPLKVLKQTVSRESFWNPSIKKWSDITPPIILNDNIICFIAFLDVFSKKNGYQTNTKNLEILDPPIFRKFS